MTARRIAVAFAALCAALPAIAQNYPVKPIRLLLPFAGGTDVVGRLIALKLSPAPVGSMLMAPGLGATQPLDPREAT